MSMKRRLPVLDLLPFLADKMKASDLRPSDYFFDPSHLSPLGNEAAAELISEFLVNEGPSLKGLTGEARQGR